MPSQTLKYAIKSLVNRHEEIVQEFVQLVTDLEEERDGLKKQLETANDEISELRMEISASSKNDFHARERNRH